MRLHGLIPALLSLHGATVHLPAAVDFSRDIQPILSENCYHCHGPDANHREADLRLDTKEGAFRMKDGQTVIHPGKAPESELIRLVRSHDADEVMPPPKSKKVLSATQIELLAKWIDEGAAWGEHWAFLPPKRPVVPSSTLGTMHNPIDAFVQAILAQEGLKLAPEADKAALLRRVTLALTGIPPASAEVDHFLQDPAPDAYEHAVDRLLGSPHYGERMVWDWLDAARYADTNGYQGDPTRTMHFWRDWAIKALNDNMPFDQFTVEQIAGDLLPNPTPEQLVATGFHRNHMVNNEGGRIPEESRVDYVQDRVETTATVWLGLTFNCCRCHNHKYDPFTQRDYYQMSAYFNSIEEVGNADAFPQANPIYRFAPPDQLAKLKAANEREQSVVKLRADLAEKARSGLGAWAKALPAAEPQWVTLPPTRVESSAQSTLAIHPDGAVLVGGTNPAQEDFTIHLSSQLDTVKALRLEALPDPSLKNQGPGRAGENGNFVLSEIEVSANGQPVNLRGGAADYEQGGFPAKDAIDGKAETGWAVMPKFGQAHQAVWLLTSPLTGPVELTVKLKHRTQHHQHVIGKFRLSATTAEIASIQPLPDEVKQLLTMEESAWTPEQRKKVEEYRLSIDADYQSAVAAAEKAKREREGIDNVLPKTMVMRDLAKPRETHVLVRGAYDNKGEKVEHGVPEGLLKLPADAPKSRLALARWLVAPENPLTARVTVNRLWQSFFGVGLVKTAEDFGVQGEKPSHPELLDWLATEFVGSGWDVKKLVRLMVTSKAFRQSSRVSAELAERDPENRLLARGPRMRLPSWMLRDQALAISGLLVDKLGGPPVKPYQPAGVWEDATFGQIRYEQDHGEALYRRSLYTFWRRIVGPTMFFDVASRQTCTVRQGRTNTPLHALVTLNETTFLECARNLGQRMLRQGGATDAERVAFGFKLCTARNPKTQEIAILTGSLQRLRQSYATDLTAAQKLLATGESKADPALAPVELAAWAALGSLLLNLDEVLTLE